MAIKTIEVQPSAGENNAGPIPPDLIIYSLLLARAQPQQMLTSGSTSANLAQLHASSVGKGGWVDEATHNLSVNWSPYRTKHSVNPSNPGTWDSSNNKIGIVYEVTTYDNVTAYFSVSVT